MRQAGVGVKLDSYTFHNRYRYYVNEETNTKALATCYSASYTSYDYCDYAQQRFAVSEITSLQPCFTIAVHLATRKRWAYR